MGTKPYLIFSLHQTRYAIAAELVTEIFLLPELIPIAEAPPDIVGLLNFHSLYIPVMHLDLRFGHQFKQCHLTDSVIVVESPGLQVGVIVHQVETVLEIDDRYIQNDLDYGREKNIDCAFVRGIINLDEEMIILLNANNLVRHPHALESLAEDESSISELESGQDFYQSYFPTASDRAKAILANRAVNISMSPDDEESADLSSIAIVKLNGEYFGLDLGIVREFANIGRVTTIPCCPEHIVGNMNLRGEILTLIDIRQPLNLVFKSKTKPTKAIVIEVDGIVAGIVVEEVIDIIALSTKQIKPLPVAIDANLASYLKGTIDGFGRSLNIIDLPKLIAKGAMTVELTA